MGIKIAYLDTFTETIDDPLRTGPPIFHEGALRMAKKVVRPDTTVEWRHLTKWSGSIYYFYPALVNEVLMANDAIKAEEEGYDAVAIQAFNDMALHACRAAVKIPVTGSGESGMLLAQLVGRKFAVVTVHPRHVYRMEANLYSCGWRDRAITNRPVRSMAAEPYFWPFMIDAFQGKPEWLINTFEKVALGCVEDGADVIISGCTPLSAALTLADYREIGNTGVPVVSPSTAMLKLAEMMVDLRRSIGLTKTEVPFGPYETQPGPVLAQVRSVLGF